MTRTTIHVCLCLAFFGCEPGDGDIGRTSIAVIVGDDDRADWYEADAIWQTRAVESIAAIVPRERVTVAESGDVALSPLSLQEIAEGQLCEDVRYLDQPSLATCSATLVDDRLVLTASHCIAVGYDCSGVAIVFDYHLTDPGTLEEIDGDDVYTCARVVTGEPESLGDFVFLELDRPVAGARRPARLVPEPPTDGQSLHMLGFPLGQPLKVTPGEAVDEGEYWVPLIDSFSGNSGSSLWTDDGAIRGMLVATDSSYSSFVLSDAGCLTESFYAEDRTMVPAIATASGRMLAALCEDGEWTGEACGGSAPGEVDAGPPDGGDAPGLGSDAGVDPGLGSDAGVLDPAVPTRGGCSAAPAGARGSLALPLVALAMLALGGRAWRKAR